MLNTTPDLYYFNPTCEYEVGNASPNWQPNRLLQQMESELDFLPMFFASGRDVVLVENLPSEKYLAHLNYLPIDLPSFISKREAFGNSKFQSQSWQSLKPWGWSPAMHKLLSPYKPSCSEFFQQSPVFNWKNEYRDLYSKKFGLEILQRLLIEFPIKDFIQKEQTAVVCKTKDDFEALLAKWNRLMVKAPWSSSGRGLQPITKTPVHPKVWEKLLGIVTDQGYALAEPLLNKKLDIAFQFRIEKQKVTFVGISNFSADANGRYIGNHLNGLPDSIDSRIRNFAHRVPDMLVEPLIRILESSELARSFEGYFGVDALIYEDKNGELKINPCLEINLRYNMGLLAIHLERFLVPGVKGMYRTWFQPGNNYFDFKTEMEKKHPLRINDGRLKSGFFSLTDPQPDSKFGAYILIV